MRAGKRSLRDLQEVPFSSPGPCPSAVHQMSSFAEEIMMFGENSANCIHLLDCHFILIFAGKENP